METNFIKTDGSLSDALKAQLSKLTLGEFIEFTLKAELFCSEVEQKEPDYEMCQKVLFSELFHYCGCYKYNDKSVRELSSLFENSFGFGYIVYSGSKVYTAVETFEDVFISIHDMDLPENGKISQEYVRDREDLMHRNIVRFVFDNPDEEFVTFNTGSKEAKSAIENFLLECHDKNRVCYVCSGVLDVPFFDKAINMAPTSIILPSTLED